VAHPLELVEAAQLDLELQRGAALAARQRHQEPGVAPLAPGGLDLAADELDRASAVGRQRWSRKGRPSPTPCARSAHRGDLLPLAQEYGGLKADQVRRLKELEAENARLRRAVADLTWTS
jgi:hypothetical protein